MFGKRSTVTETTTPAIGSNALALPLRNAPDTAPSRLPKPDMPIYAPARVFERSDAFYETKKQTLPH